MDPLRRNRVGPQSVIDFPISNGERWFVISVVATQTLGLFCPLQVAILTVATVASVSLNVCPLLLFNKAIEFGHGWKDFKSFSLAAGDEVKQYTLCNFSYVFCTNHVTLELLLLSIKLLPTLDIFGLLHTPSHLSHSMLFNGNTFCKTHPTITREIALNILKKN